MKKLSLAGLAASVPWLYWSSSNVSPFQRTPHSVPAELGQTPFVLMTSAPLLFWKLAS
jgi:hypothetical protein